MPYSTIEEAVWQTLEVAYNNAGKGYKPKPDTKENQLRALNLILTDDSVNDDLDPPVTMERFGRVLALFGPIVGPTDDNASPSYPLVNILERLSYILSQPSASSSLLVLP